MRFIEITLAIYSKYIDVKDISDYIDLPNAILWHPPLPQYFDPAWSIRVYSKDRTIKKPLLALKSIIAPKMDRLIDLCAKDGISTQISISIKTDCYANRPVISLPSTLLLFFEKLDADFVFDIIYSNE